MNMKKGFTLIEIMIVVAIIAILAAIAVPNFIAYRENAQNNSCLSTVKQIENACEAWVVQHPNNIGSCKEDCSDLWNSTGTGFLKMTAAPTCPAGGTYAIKWDSDKSTYTVTCTKHSKNADGGWALTK